MKKSKKTQIDKNENIYKEKIGTIVPCFKIIKQCVDANMM